ncbi:hypothetical protein IEQ34_011344 [Dendrobium chrysotoxum]|uniref:Uncharacterized protein n=1 Tax=Dendrobium chrysotoxum TaxID=161865 RepID=A0AAV7GVC7_DENCH|nr:hypothetical protein IEQ34_011344 [Dendrobium chrysotoxum]
MGDHASSKNPSEDRPAQRSEVSKRIQKAPKSDDVISIITEDSFISFRKKFHFPNDLVMKVPARSDRACFPPPEYVTVYEFSLRAGLRFPPSSELIDILTICEVCLSQLSYRVILIVMGLIVLFRDRGVVLFSECLSRMGRLFSDAQGRISFRSKWSDIRTRDPSKGWISNFFYVQNDWESLVPLHIGAEDLLRILKLPDLDAIHYEVRYLSRYINEEYLFKVELYTQAGRSHAQMLKKYARVPEVIPQKSHSKRPGSEEGLQAPMKKKANKVLTVVSKGPRVSPSKSYILEDVLNHQCIGRRRAEELVSPPLLLPLFIFLKEYISDILLSQYSDFKLEMTKTLNDWNKEFVKVKYLQGEYKKKYDSKVKEMKVVEDQLEGCRAELANKITSSSSQNERMDRLHIELVEAHATIKQQEKTQQVLEAENERLQSVLSEKEAQQLPSAVIEEFKKSYSFKIIIEDHIQEARSHIYDVKVKALEAECAENGFIRGFMKGVRIVYRKTGAKIEGLTPSQASGDASSDSGGEELESELQ